MQVFTFFYNRFTDATTSLALAQNGINHKILIHSHADADKFKTGGTLAGEAIVTDNPKGLAYQRNSALHLMNTGEWAVFMCDDFQKVLAQPMELLTSKTLKMPVDFKNQQAYRFKTRDHSIDLKTMFSVFPKLIEIAEANHIHLIGFSLHDNPQNLANKFTTRGLADGRFWLVKKSNYQFDPNAQLIDDVAWTAENLCRHGNVLTMNWIIPYFKRYTAGGFGTQSERLARRRQECAYLADKYNPLVKIASKTNWPAGTHIRIYGSDGNINMARKNLGYPFTK